MIVSEGKPPVPVTYQGWAEWRVLRREAALNATPLLEWVPCGLCQGSARYLESAANGEGLIPRTCTQCEGTGTRLMDVLRGNHTYS